MIRALWLAALLASAGATIAAGPGADRRRTVAGWQIEDVAEQDGGRLVSMRRDALGYRLQFQVSFWRGNQGRIQGTLVEHSDCTNGETIDRDAAPGVGEIRALLAGHLADCGASPRQITAALQGIEGAYRLASAWADAADAATAAEAAEIANYGRE